MRPTSSFITFQPLFVLLTLFSCFTLSIASPMPAFDPGTASLVDGGGPIAGRDMVSAGGLAVERRQAQIYMGRATIYEPGLGACGTSFLQCRRGRKPWKREMADRTGRVTRATDLVGAIPPAQFGSGCKYPPSPLPSTSLPDFSCNSTTQRPNDPTTHLLTCLNPFFQTSSNSPTPSPSQIPAHPAADVLQAHS